jgi:hypothetical protein
LAVIEDKRGDIAFGVDRVEVRAGLRPVRVFAEIHPLDLDGDTGFPGDDMGRKGAGPGSVIELHVTPHPAAGH